MASRHQYRRAALALIALSLLNGCANSLTPAEQTHAQAIKKHNASYFEAHKQEQPAPAARVTLEERLAKLKIGTQEGMAISYMGVAPVRTNQIRTSGGDQHVLVYAQNQFWTPGQAFVQGMARESGSPVAHDGFITLTFQNHVLTAIQRSDY